MMALGGDHIITIMHARQGDHRRLRINPRAQTDRDPRKLPCIRQRLHTAAARIQPAARIRGRAQTLGCFLTAQQACIDPVL